MRIKITESQYSKIRLVTESEEYVNRFKSLCEEKGKEINLIYSKIMGLSVYEILSGEVDVSKMEKTVSQYSDLITNSRRSLIKMWDSGLIEKDNENFEFEIDDISYPLERKLSKLDDILFALVKLANESEDSEWLKLFQDIKPLDIQSF